MTIMDQPTDTTNANTGNATRARDSLINELLRDSETLQKKTTKTPTRKPASTPGGIPAVPAASIAVASATAAVGALGAATGGVGVAVLAGAGAVAAAPGVVRRARRATAGGMSRTVTKTTKTSGGGVSRGSSRGTGLPKLGGRKGGSSGGSSRGKRSGLGGVASGARKSAAAKAAGISAARKARPTSPIERRKAQVAARRARVEAAAQKRTQAAAAKRVAKAHGTTGSTTGSKYGGKGLGKGFGLPKIGGSKTGGSGGSGRTTGRKSPHARIARAHKKNQAANARAAAASKRRANRAHKTDQRRSNAINDARHKRRAGGKGPTRSISSNGKAAQLARKRARAAVWAAGLATAAVIGARSKRAGRSLRDYYQDTRTHLLGGAALLNGLDQAEAYNAQHGIRPIPDVPASLVHKRTPLAITGGTSQSGVNPMSNPFNLLPEAQDMLTKIQRAELTGALNVVYGFDQLPQAVQAMSDSWIVMAQRAADEMPFHPEVSAALENVHRAFGAAVKAAEEVGPITRKMHAADIERLENQRRNERAWDVDNNQ